MAVDRLFAAAMATLAIARAIAAVTAAGTTLPLTTVRAVHNQTAALAARAYPVHLRGVVTFYDQSIHTGRGTGVAPSS